MRRNSQRFGGCNPDDEIVAYALGVPEPPIMFWSPDIILHPASIMDCPLDIMLFPASIMVCLLDIFP